MSSFDANARVGERSGQVDFDARRVAALEARRLHRPEIVFGTALSAKELLKRTWKEIDDDDVVGLAAQLSYYFFLALFPAILFLLSLASFFPLGNLTDEIGRSLGRIASPQVVDLVQDQMRRLAGKEDGGLLTLGAVGALWSSSAALVSIVGALNRAYDIEEGRPWWKVRLTAIGLTVGLALMVVTSFTLIVAGPTIADMPHTLAR